MRQLVTIRKITAIEPIEGADLISVATVDGWKVVVGKNQFEAGEEVIMFEIDSLLPIDPRFEFLRKCFKRDASGREGFRLRSVKLRGEISQGLLMPVADFPEIEGKTNLAEALGVIKWEAPIPAELAGEVLGAIPGVIKYTDQERIQNLPDYLERYKETEFEASIKIDGSSTTFYLYEDHFGVCGHNWEYREDAKNSQWRVARRCGVEEALRALGREIALQGEVYGEGIQTNPEKVKGQHVAIFDIWDIHEGRYMTTMERMETFNKLRALGMTLNHVPILGVSKPFKVYPTMEAILAAADGPSMNPDVRREGLVYKSASLIDGQTVSFKTLSNRYLLKEKD